MKSLKEILQEHEPDTTANILITGASNSLHRQIASIMHHTSALPDTGRWSGRLISVSSSAGFLAEIPTPVLGETVLIHPLPSPATSGFTHATAPGAACRQQDHGADILAEITGFQNNLTTIAPLEKPNPQTKLGPGCLITPTSKPLTIWAGPALKGRVLDPLGRPLDQMGPLPTGILKSVTVASLPTPPLQRKSRQTRFKTGIQAIDGLTPLLTGQRVALVAPAGTGKTTLLTSIAARMAASSTAPGATAAKMTTILCLVGERGREAADLINNRLDHQTRSNLIIFLSTSDDPPLARVKCAEAATAAAEALSNRGEQVLLLMDSLTRYARALRDVAIGAGEPQGRRGYPPSMASSLARLLERAGPGTQGCITAIYTLLVEEREDDDPLAEEVRSLVDAHLVLDRRMAAEGIFPALHPVRSVSRIALEHLRPPHQQALKRFKRLWAVLDEYRDLLAAGAWRPGNNLELDQAVEIAPMLEQFITAAAPDFYLGSHASGGSSDEEALIRLMLDSNQSRQPQVSNNNCGEVTP